MDLGAVARDAFQAPPLGRADLDRQPRAQLGDDTLDCRLLAERHLPVGASEDLEATLAITLSHYGASLAMASLLFRRWPARVGI
jgi:hypothetical protein